MFGWGGKKKADGGNTPKPKQAAAPLSTGYDPSDFDDDIEAPELSESDLNDPALLAELQQLAGASKPKKAALPPPPPAPAKRKPAPARPAAENDGVDVEAVLAGVDFGSDDVEVQFDESDMRDPELLAALRAMGGADSASDAEDESPVSPGSDASRISDGDNSPVSDKPMPKAQPHVPKTPERKSSLHAPPPPQHHVGPVETQLSEEALASSQEEETLPLEYRLKSKDVTVLAKYVQLEKIKALNKKRAGDREGAVQSLRDSKALEQRLQQVTDAIERKEAPPSYQPPTTTVNEFSPPPQPIAVTKSNISISVTPQAVEPGTTAEAPPEVQLSVSSENVDLSNQLPTSTLTLEALTRRQLDYKRHALEAKKANDLGRAREFLTVAKLMQDPIDSLSIGVGLPDGYHLPPPPSEMPITQPAEEAKPAAASTPVKTPQKAGMKASATNQTPTKNNGTPGKDAPHTPLGVVVRETIDLGNISHPTSSASPTIKSGADLFQHIETALESQIATCTTVAAHYYKQTKKNEALTFHKMKKGLQTDLDTLRVLKATPNAQAPAFKYTILRYEIEQAIPEIAPDEMEMQIVRAWDLGSREVKSEDVESLVAFDLGWPVDEATSETAAEGKGETGTVKRNAAPEYAFSRKVKIARTRGFQRYLERKKATFEVFHYQRGFLLLGKRVSLGRIQVKMEPLLTKCEVHEIAELVDAANPRRTTGGKIEVRLRLRSPISKPDVVVKEERWLTIDFSGGAGTNVVTTPVSASSDASPLSITSPEGLSPASASPAKPKPARAPSPNHLTPAGPQAPSSAQPPKRQPSPQTQQQTQQPPRANTPSPQTPTPTAGTTEDTTDLELQFASPDTLVSNAVLEKELESVTHQILALQKQPSSPTTTSTLEDLQDKKLAYELRMNMLVLRVQGGLSMDGYVNEVKKAIGETTRMAQAFKRAGKVELARQALMRVKWMRAEVEEVEAALAEG
ncbi:uncharacterized protein EV422DRAFT_28179 [Fimicolochytrium jonesii]|uniref:uncharacterized protein n=1 Tax=Fimicolochytrium jonesii TaxID=1396493 RepID=UPI0022FDBF52|nr:uncharacterized protein EV422DRAFT_28179 [Fimicolochytrium jonesii]KAI8827160.1 hypothetical protein EV422DRAFT_28179 [Fimicolochytrium jonesii]